MSATAAAASLPLTIFLLVVLLYLLAVAAAAAAAPLVRAPLRMTLARRRGLAARFPRESARFADV